MPLNKFDRITLNLISIKLINRIQKFLKAIQLCNMKILNYH